MDALIKFFSFIITRYFWDLVKNLRKEFLYFEIKKSAVQFFEASGSETVCCSSLISRDICRESNKC